MAGIRQRKRIAAIRGIFVLGMLVFAALFGGAANDRIVAADENLKNTYALCITSGSKGLDTSKLQYIAVRYVDTEGTERTHYMFASEDIADSRSRAHDAGNSDKVHKYITSQYNYTLGTWDEAAVCEAFQTGTFFFEPEFAVRSIKKIQFLTSGKGTWVCQGIRVYQVDKINGYMPYGTVSSSYFADFSGTLLAKMRNTEGDGVSASFVWSDPEVFNVGGDKSNYILEEPSAQERDYNKDGSNVNNIAWKFDFADVYMAGAEVMVNEVENGRSGLEELDVLDTLNLYVEYKDIYDNTRKINLPVILNVLAWAKSRGTDMSAPVVGIAQQGESIAFGGNLPDYKELTKIVLTCDPDVVESDAGAYPENRARNTVAEGITEMGDSVSLTGVTFYDLSDGTRDAALQVQDNVLEVAVKGEPAYYYVAGNVNGTQISYGRAGVEMKVGESASLKPYKAGSNTALQPRESNTDRYLIEIVTDTAASAGTVNDLSVRFDYDDVYGNSQTTSKYNLRQQVSEFYGYWPSNTNEFSYLQGAAAGGVMRFIFTLNDVDKFTKAYFSVSGNDDWQMAALKIYKLASLEKRTAVWRDIRVGGDAYSNRIYNRSFQGTELLVLSHTLLVQKDDVNKELSFESEAVAEQEEIDWTPDDESMRYEDCCKDLGFVKQRARYSVNVQVASEKGNTSSDDCGSRNQFYFKLIFENGESAYVLANQQLSSDGFRAGVEESFTINTNRDYGELASVEIIPDDVSENSDIYDKLNIESISVRKLSAGKAVQQWTITDVGWVEINYREDGETTITSQQGRTASEIARTYLVDYSSYAINLLFCITTGEYTAPYKQFEGEVICDLSYTNEKGEEKTYSFDMVQEMYKYANQTMLTRDVMDAMGKNVIKKDAVTSDSSFMFRANHTDRFMLSLDNVSGLNSIRMKARSKADATEWDIKELSVSMINEEGTLQLNSNDEYIRTGGDIEHICSAQNVEKDVAAKIYLPIGQEQQYTLYFTENEIRVDESASNWVSVISRQPASHNDKVNVFVYPTKPEVADSFGVKAAVSYTNVSGEQNQVASGELKRYGSGDSTMFYITDLNADSMATFDGLILESVGAKTSDCRIAKAYVQQVRSGVVIDTWALDYDNSSIRDLSVVRRPEEQGTGSDDRQVVSLSLGEDTPRKTLEAEKTDMVVSIQYTLAIGPGNIEYSSSNVFLTDGQVERLYAGELLNVEFREPHLKKLRSIKLSSVGGAQIELAGAVAATYSGQETSTANRAATASAEGNADNTGNESSTAENGTAAVSGATVPMDSSLNNTTISKLKCTGWYSFFTESKKITKGTVTLRPDSNVPDSSKNHGQDELALMTVKFTTSSDDNNSLTDGSEEKGLANGTTTPVSVTVGYYNYNKDLMEYRIDNLRAVVSDGSDFGDGGVATVKFMLPELFTNMGGIRWVYVEPYDSDPLDRASWKPEFVAYTAEWGEKIITEQRYVNWRIYEGQGDKIFFANILISAKAEIYAGRSTAGEALESRDTTTMDNRSIVVNAGQAIAFTPTVSGSLEGSIYKLESVDVTTGGTQELNTEDNGVTGGDRIIMDTTELSGNYRLTIFSKENTKTSVSFDISVREIAPESQTPTEEPAPSLAPAQETVPPTSAPVQDATPAPEATAAGEAEGEDRLRNESKGAKNIPQDVITVSTMRVCSLYYLCSCGKSVDWAGGERKKLWKIGKEGEPYCCWQEFAWLLP